MIHLFFLQKKKRVFIKLRSSVFLVMTDVKELFSDNLWIDRAQYFISIPITVFLLIFHTIHLVQSQRSKNIQTQTANNMNSSSITHKKMSREQKMNQFLTFGMFIGSITVQIVCIIIVFGGYPYPSTNCNLVARIGSSLQLTSKSLIYYIYVLRMKMAFKDSQYQYSNTVIYGLVVFITLYILCAIFAFFTEVSGGWIYDASEDIYWCQIYAKVWTVLIAGFLDCMIQILCLVLFIKPLRQILKSSSDQNNGRFIYVVIKVNVLTIFAISTTFLFNMAMLFEVGGIFLGIDGGINLLCIMLMASDYKYHYDLICKSCHISLEKCKNSASAKSKNDNTNSVDIQTQTVDAVATK